MSLVIHSYENMTDIFLSNIALFHIGYHYNVTNLNGQFPKILQLTYRGRSWICVGRYNDLIEWLDHVPPKTVPTLGMYLGEPMVYRAETPREIEARDRRVIYEMLATCCLNEGLQLKKTFGIPAGDEFTQGAHITSFPHLVYLGLLLGYVCHSLYPRIRRRSMSPKT